MPQKCQNKLELILVEVAFCISGFFMLFDIFADQALKYIVIHILYKVVYHVYNLESKQL